MPNEFDEIRKDTFNALEDARRAFEKHLRDLDYDTSYWNIRFTTWALSADGFEPLWKIVIDSREK